MALSGKHLDSLTTHKIHSLIRIGAILRKKGNFQVMVQHYFYMYAILFYFIVLDLPFP